MSTALATRSQTALASRINREHEKVLGAARNMVAHAVACGGLLAQVKEAVSHGQWGPWLAENFAGSEWTAQVYMRLARSEHANPGSITEMPSIDMALKSIATPRRAALPSGSVDPDSPVGKLLGAARSAGRGEVVIDAEVVEDAPPGIEPRKWTGLLGQMAAVRDCMNEAAQPGLSPESSAGALNEASTAARRAAVDLEHLAGVVRRRAT